MKKNLITMPLISNKLKRIFQLLIIISIVIPLVPALFDLLGTEKGEIPIITKVLLSISGMLLIITKDKVEDEMLLQLRLRAIILSLIAAIFSYVTILVIFDDSLDTFNTLVLIFSMYFASFTMSKYKLNKQ